MNDSTNPSDSTPEHEPAPVVLVPELAVSPEVPAVIDRMRQVIDHSGLEDLCRQVYEVVLPAMNPMIEGASDEVFHLVSTRSGWGEMYARVTDLASALMICVGAGYADLTHPVWIRDEDAAHRDAVDIVDLSTARPELFATMMDELRDDPEVAEVLAKRGELRKRDIELARKVRDELVAEGVITEDTPWRPPTRQELAVEGLAHLMETGAIE